jgi:alanyl-tRNA synthetase
MDRSSRAVAEIEQHVNRGVWASVPVVLEQKAYKDAVAGGAMALFGEKYGDVVRVVTIPGCRSSSVADSRPEHERDRTVQDRK